MLRSFEAVAGQVHPVIEAHVFLRKANLSVEKQSQIVSAAMSRSEYEPLRETPSSRRFLERAFCEWLFPCLESSPERTLPKWSRPRMKKTRESTSSRKMRLPMTS